MEYSYDTEKSFKITTDVAKKYSEIFSNTLAEKESINNFFSLVPTDRHQTIIDIGAHVGLYSMYAKYLPQAEFHSFEIYKPSFDVLNENLKINGITNVKTYNIGLSNKSGTTTLNVSKQESLNTLGTTPIRFKKDKTVEVNVTTLDSLGLAPDFIKIDTEGWEYYILLGAMETINKYKPVIQIEWNERNMKQCGVNPTDLLNLLLDFSYVIICEQGEELILKYVDKEDKSKGICNYAIHPIGYDQSKTKTDTYFTRATGRTANSISEYIYWRLRAKQDGKAFQCTYNFLYKDADKYVPKADPVYMGLPEKVPVYITSHLYFKDHVDYIREILHVKDIPQTRDLVIHLRLDDVMEKRYTVFTILPFSVYIELLRSMPTPANITVIGMPIDNFECDYVDCMELMLKNMYPNVPVTISTGNSIEKDFEIISSCKTLIASTSTFWYFPSLLSKNVEKIYYPEFGLCNEMDLDKDPRYEAFAKSLSPLKINKHDIHRVFL
jgi:FkbM family methyltransferase